MQKGEEAELMKCDMEQLKERIVRLLKYVAYSHALLKCVLCTWLG